jgi:hypothetical protein
MQLMKISFGMVIKNNKRMVVSYLKSDNVDY